MAKLKGHKMSYNDRWKNELLRRVPIVMSTPTGHKLRELRDEIRREHHLNRHGSVK